MRKTRGSDLCSAYLGSEHACFKTANVTGLVECLKKRHGLRVTINSADAARVSLQIAYSKMGESIYISEISEKLIAPDSNNAALAHGVCPKLVSRSQWGALAPVMQDRLQGSAHRAIIHHTSMWPCRGPQDCLAQLRHIQKLHMRERDFNDIGYNFLIGGDGTVYEGRGWGVVGAHAKGNNHDSLGIAFMGNFNDETPSPAALSSTKKLLQCGVSLGYLHPAYILLGHRDLAETECPGNILYEALPLLAQH